MTTTIRFYKKSHGYYEFSNFYQAPIIIDNLVYQTTEHYYQAAKFFETEPEYVEQIRLSVNPFVAKKLGSSKQHAINPNWETVKEDFMISALVAKFTQHQELQDLLISTQNCRLIEASPIDYYWGIGNRQNGQNRLGTLLMELRDTLISSSRAE